MGVVSFIAGVVGLFHLSWHIALCCGIEDELAIDANLDYVRPFSRSRHSGRHTELGRLNVKRYIQAKSAGEKVNFLLR